MPFSLLTSYSSTSPPTPNKKGKRREKRRNQRNTVDLLMLVHSLWNKHYDKVGNTHRRASWWWNSSARGTDEEPLSYNHRRSYEICSLVLHVVHCIILLWTGTFLHLVPWLEGCSLTSELFLTSTLSAVVTGSFYPFLLMPDCPFSYLAVFPVMLIFWSF